MIDGDFPAQLQGDALHGRGGDAAATRAAGLSAAREGDLVFDARMRDELGAASGTGARHDVDDARRGKPASMASSANRNAVNGVAGAGLSTTVQPTASAGATFHEANSNGKSPRGMIAPTTPTGSRVVCTENAVDGPGIVSP